MPGWRDLERSLDRRIERAFGESVRISFMKDGRVDPTRPMATVRGVLHVGGDDSFAPGTGYRARLSAGQGELVLTRAEYAGPTVRIGDRVRADDRAGQPWFEVRSISDRYSDLIVLSLNQA